MLSHARPALEIWCQEEATYKKPRAHAKTGNGIKPARIQAAGRTSGVKKNLRLPFVNRDSLSDAFTFLGNLRKFPRERRAALPKSKSKSGDQQFCFVRKECSNLKGFIWMATIIFLLRRPFCHSNSPLFCLLFPLSFRGLPESYFWVWSNPGTILED